MNDRYYDSYGDDYEQIMKDIFEAEAREEFRRNLISPRNTAKVILPTGTVLLGHRWRPYARTGLRYRSRMRGTENMFAAS